MLSTKSMNTPQISLAIYGNRLSSAGWEPLFWLNLPPFPELPNLGYPGVADVPYYFVVRNADRYTQFTLVHNKVKSYMASRPGMLKISIAIPYGYALAGGASPYDVLLRIRETFVTQCMTPIAGMVEAYEFRERMVGDAVFQSILAQFPLVPRRTALKPMRGKDVALLLADAENMRLFMIDTHYPELASFAEVVVATSGNDSLYASCIRGLQIPRHVNYRLFVNGQPRQWNVQNYYDDMTVIRSQEDDRCFETVQASFSVNQLMAGPVASISQDGYGFRADLDPERERVDVQIKARPRTKVFMIEVVGLSNEDARAFLRGARIYLSDGQIVEHVNGRFTLRGYELVAKPLVKCTSGNFRIVNQSLSSTTISVRVERAKVIQPRRSGIPMAHIYLQDPKDVVDRRKIVSFSLLNLQTLKSLSIKGHFVPSDEPSYTYLASLMLTEECIGDVELSFNTDAVTYKGVHAIRPGENKITISGEKTRPLPFYVRYKKHLVVGGISLAVLLLLAGILLSVFGIIKFTSSEGDKLTEATDSIAATATKVPSEIAVPTTLDANDPESVKAFLAKEDLTFDEVDYLYNQLRTSRVRETNQDLFLKVELYRQIVQYIREGNINPAYSIQKDNHVLLPQHEQYFNAAFASFIDAEGKKQNYTPKQVPLAKKYFKEHCAEFGSFREMNNIAYAPEVAVIQAVASPKKDESTPPATKPATKPVPKPAANPAPAPAPPKKAPTPQQSVAPTAPTPTPAVSTTPNKQANS